MEEINYLYWIHDDFMTDIFTQGYVGISKDPKTRFRTHKRNHPEWKNYNFDIILIGERNYVLEIEKRLRPKYNIGLNEASSGGDPPSSAGKSKSAETKLKMSKARQGKVVLNNNTWKQKPYVCIDPTGNEYHIVGLRQFCREHNLRQSSMLFVAEGRYKQHQGWICRKNY